MTAEEVAAELYFHAVIYYFFLWLRRFHLHVPLILKSAYPIDLQDYGDTPFRKFCFKVLWYLPGGRKSDSDQ